MDYLEDRLPKDRRGRIREHLETCETCAADYAWATEFRQRADSEGLLHLRPSRLVQISESEHAVLTPFEERHLASCESCSEELSWAKEIPGLPPEEPPKPAVSERPAWSLFQAFRRHPVRVSAGLAAALATVIVGVILTNRENSTWVKELAVVHPIPIPEQRTAGAAGAFEKKWREGKIHYSHGRYQSAEAALRDALFEATRLEESDPDLHATATDVRILLGSTFLLRNRPEEAIGTLKSVVSEAATDTQREEGLWQLANAYLMIGNKRAAEDRLNEVVLFSTGRHREEAEFILTKLRRGR
jgi:hypothetical protein